MRRPIGLILVTMLACLTALCCVFQFAGCLRVFQMPTYVTPRNIYCFPAWVEICAACCLDAYWKSNGIKCFYCLAALKVWNHCATAVNSHSVCRLSMGCTTLTFLIFQCCRFSTSPGDMVLTTSCCGYRAEVQLLLRWMSPLFPEIRAWV